MEKSFNDWWEELKQIAEGRDFPLGDKETYREFYDDGDSPEETLETELSYADE